MRRRWEMSVLGFVLALVLFPMIAWAAASKKNSVEIGLYTRVVPSEATIGQEIRLLIQAEFPKGFSIEPISDKIDIKPFELRRIGKPVSSKKGDKIVQTVTLYLALYELGDFRVPSIPVAVWNIAGQRGQSRTKPWPVKIVSVGKKKTDTDDIRPIKGPVSFNLRYWTDAGLGLAAVCLSALLVMLIVRRRRQRLAQLESLLPPEARAELELQRLHGHRHILAGRHKEFFTELSDILRRYLERRYGSQITEMTTTEALRFLKEKIADPALIGQIKEALQTSDLVKFALYEPEKTIAEDEEKKIRDIVAKTTPVPETAAPREKHS